MQAVGLDVGTMNIVSMRQLEGEKVEKRVLRNMFLKVSPEDVSRFEISQTDLDFVEQRGQDGELEQLFIVGEDAFRFANIFGKDVNRPRSRGVISPQEIDAQDVLALVIEKMIGRTKNGMCIFSVPAQAVDGDMPPVSYHETVWSNILNSLGYESQPLNEAQAIIYATCKDTNYSGIAISFGCGLTNVACCYKGTPTLKFSVCRGGDWLDAETAKSTGTNVITRITRAKETGLDLTSPKGKNKRDTRIKSALIHYHKVLVEYVLEIFKDQFLRASEGLEIENEIPIILSGGTSIPEGFVEIFKEIFDEIRDFPYKISEIKRTENPLTSVARGCLVYNLWRSKTKR